MSHVNQNNFHIKNSLTVSEALLKKKLLERFFL